MERITLLTEYMEYIILRKAVRFYPWILGGLIVLHFCFYAIFTSFIVAFIPVTVAGWFYYRRGGVIAGLLAFIIDLLLIDTFEGKLDWNTIISLENGILLGHLFIGIIGFGIGYLREVIERRYQIDKQLSSRERLLTLINMATSNILEMKNPDDAYFHLLTHLTNLFVADYAYLTLWEDQRQQLVLAADTRILDKESARLEMQADIATAVTSALDSGRTLILADLQNASKGINPTLSNELQLSAGSALVIPLLAKEFKIGAVILGFEAPRRFDRRELESFELMNSQLILALRNVQQERKIEKQLKQANALVKIESALSISQRVGVESVLQLIVDSAKELIVRSKDVVLHLLDEEQKVLIPRAVAGYTTGSKSKLNMRLGEGIAGQVVVTGEAISVADTRTDPRFLNRFSPPAFRSLIVTPIKVNDRCVGTLSIQSDEVGVFSSDEIELLGTFGTQAAIAYENANLLETIRQDYKELDAVYHLTQNLVASLEPDQLLTDAVEFLQTAFGIRQIQIYLLDEKNEQLLASYGAGVIGNQLAERGYSLPVANGIIGHVAMTGEPFFTNGPEQVVFFVHNPLLPDTQSEMTLPIKVDGRVVGVMDIQEASSNPISLRQMKLMETVTHQLAVALQKAMLYSELKTSLEQEKTTRAQLMQSERLAVVGRLLASVSHELNNPLQAIQNALFLIKEEEKLSPQGSQDLEVVLSETERMSSLISRLHDTYRPTQAEDFQDIQLNAVIEDVFALTSTYMRHRKTIFEFHPEPELPTIPGIPGQIRQILLNLFMNAMEAMEMEGKLIVRTQNIPEQDQILFSVADTGPGISPEILPHIFEPFITNKSTGTGLGMTITRDIILQHHGDIQAENATDGGAIFTVRLPTKRDEQK